ncbi:MAG: MBL fold metallo-hydrolase [Pseudomonadales bacterium]|nr:MBL fold metallo-hydrolase [Pseudomonadales bacterium]MCP5182744.1 MBL fold metallo-hydrolase [Pseudomonadales bacterium]
MRRLLPGLAVTALLLAGGGWLLLGVPAVQDWLLGRMLSVVMTQSPVTHADGLRIFMCGTSSPLPAPGRAQACVAVMAGDDLFLVDAGAGSANTFNLAGEDSSNLRAILLTHFHSDHIAAIPDFNLNSWVGGRSRPLELIGPAGVERIAEGLNEAYALDRGYRVAHHGEVLLPPALGELSAREIGPGVFWNAGGLTITAFPVDHSPVSPAVGYRFDYQGRSVVISGDSNVTPTLIAAAKGADLVLHDALSLPIVQAMAKTAEAAGRIRQARILGDIQGYHASTESLSQIVAQAAPRMLAVYHLVPAPRNTLMSRMFERDLPTGTVITSDGMVFSLPADSSDIHVD